MYATVPHLLEEFGAVEIARICEGDKSPFLVTADLLTAAAAGEPLGDATPEEVAATERALLRAQTALQRATSRMDSYLGGRATLPLTAPVIEANGLGLICLNIARYFLQDDRATEEVRNRYKDDMSWLKSVSTGAIALVGGETGGPVAAPVRTVSHGQAKSSIDWSRF